MAACSSDSDNPDEKGWRKYETVFTNAKAGMDGVDKDRVKRIVYDASKDSAYFKNEQRKQMRTEEKVKEMQEKVKVLGEAELAAWVKKADAKLAALELERDLSRIWCHVDMDAFYASVEERHNPALKAQPLAVGGMGMISTANYEARKYGVRSGMPGFIAMKLCPQLVFARPDYSRYSRASEAVREVLAQFDPDFEPLSLDEAYLDVTDCCKSNGWSAAEVAEELRRRVRDATNLTASVGVAANTTLAKVCSDINKPDGQFVLPRDRTSIVAFVGQLPVRKVPFVGKVTEQLLTQALDIKLGKDIWVKRGHLAACLSETATDFFLRVVLGLGRMRHPEPQRDGQVLRKGISCERTFPPVSEWRHIAAKVSDLASHLERDMARESLLGRSLTVKMKLTSFEVRTRAVTLAKPTRCAKEMGDAALKVIRAELPLSLRLLGLRMSHFQAPARPPPGQRPITSFVQQHAAPEKPPSSPRSRADAPAASLKPEAGAPQAKRLATGRGSAASAAGCLLKQEAPASGSRPVATAARPLVRSAGSSRGGAAGGDAPAAAGTAAGSKRGRGLWEMVSGRCAAATERAVLSPQDGQNAADSRQASSGQAAGRDCTLNSHAATTRAASGLTELPRCAADAPNTASPSAHHDAGIEEDLCILASLSEWNNGQSAAAPPPHAVLPQAEVDQITLVPVLSAVPVGASLGLWQGTAVPLAHAAPCLRVRSSPAAEERGAAAASTGPEAPAASEAGDSGAHYGAVRMVASRARADNGSAPALRVLSCPAVMCAPPHGSSDASPCWQCPICSAVVPPQDRQEHQDWHYARDLHRAERLERLGLQQGRKKLPAACASSGAPARANHPRKKGAPLRAPSLPLWVQRAAAAQGDSSCAPGRRR